MALSNIFRNPKKEITETLVGFLFIGVIVGGVVTIAACEWLRVPVLVILLGGFVLTFITFVAHFIGEEIIDLFKRR
jgi:chromate transport protein ChrA